MYKKNVVNLSLIGEEGKRHYVVIKDFNAYTYDHTLYCGRKHFCCYCLQAFSTNEILNVRFKIALKLMVIKMIKRHKKGEHVQFKNFVRGIKSPFMIHADFKSTLVTVDNGMQNPEEF